MTSSTSSSSGIAGRAQVQLDESATEYAIQSPVIDLTGSDYETCDANRASKRQKVGTTIDSLDTPQASTTQLSQPCSFASQDTGPSTPTERPSWSFQDEVSDPETPNDDLKKSCLPLPMRPWDYRPQPNIDNEDNIAEIIALNNQLANIEVQTTPFNMKVPEVAPILGSDTPLDFYPWKGLHPEDQLTETTAKQGFYDRVPMAQNETNTARPALYANFKHRSGLKLLSSIFTTALDRRQSRCRVTDFSTFKPPPRVTLTDIKREAWLRDLANPSVPLRKLSRTIPHGIRGKILLDQCVNKGIPVGRAVWLAKCVGANEIRAFKRKGTSAAIANGLEIKWVRDWSVNVQQFVESIVGACGTPNWAPTMSYVVKLAARLFQEHLLDRDLCQEWFLQSLSEASIAILPVWLSMLGTYWAHIVQFRKRGRRLAEILLEKLQKLLALDHFAPKQPIVERLSFVVKTFAETNSSCFILPLTWRTYKHTLITCFSPNMEADSQKVDWITKRNETVIKAELCRRSDYISPSQQFISLLDSPGSANDIDTLFLSCETLNLGYDILLSKVLGWASTNFRCGSARIYATVRLIRRWRKAGVDTDSHIITFLQSKGEAPSFSTDNIYHIVCELVRSHSFAVGKYLQWLLARGAVRDYVSSIPADVSVLTHLPRHRLPTHVWNLRNAILLKAGFSVDSEYRLISSIKFHIHRELADIVPKPSGDPIGGSPLVDGTHISWTIKSEIGHWLREHVISCRKSSLRILPDNDTPSAVEISALTIAQFFKIRDVIESLGDLSLLADILRYATSSDEVPVLISIADTLNYHTDSFKAIGAFVDIFRGILTTYSCIGKSDHLTLELISSLLEIGIKLPTETPAVTMLRRDLSRFDKKFLMMVSSPVSEQPLEPASYSRSTVPDAIRQLLDSGHSIDESNLRQIFDVLVKRLQQPSELDSSHKTARYLSELRNLNPKVFDVLMLKWIISLLKASSRPSFAAFLPPLIGVGCVTFHAFFALIKGVLASDADQQSLRNITELRYELVDLICLESLQEIDLVSYRYKIARQEYISVHAHDALTLINDTFAEISGNHNTQGAKYLFCDLIIQKICKSDLEKASRLLEEFPNCLSFIHKALDILLGFNSRDIPVIQQSHVVIDLIDEFSLPSCLIKLQLLLDATPNEDVARNGVVDSLFKTAEIDIRNGERRWLEVLKVLPVTAAQLIRHRAEHELLSLPLSFANSSDLSYGESALIYLRIIEELSYSIPDEFISSSIGSDIADKMMSLLQGVVESGIVKNAADSLIPNSPGFACDNQISELRAGLWFYILLRLVALHRLSFPAHSTSRTEVNNQTRILIQICYATRLPLFTNRLTKDFSPLLLHFTKQISLVQNLPSTWANLRLQAFDVCCALADTLRDEARFECARFLREKCPPVLPPQNDPRLLFIFGPIPDHQIPIVTHSGPNPSTNGPSTNIPPHLQAAPSQASNMPTFTAPDDPNSFTDKLRLQQNGRVTGPYQPRPWEMLGEAAPVVGVNDTPINLTFFGTRQTRHS
ncbi:RNA polymerase II mediator complex subunit [Ophidiomyces ophidiicola]|nr:RNA polymerase II mediator complex subunit [Ophidiomyces ophidiicola]